MEKDTTLRKKLSLFSIYELLPSQPLCPGFLDCWAIGPQDKKSKLITDTIDFHKYMYIIIFHSSSTKINTDGITHGDT